MNTQYLLTNLFIRLLIINYYSPQKVYCLFLLYPIQFAEENFR